MKKKSLFLGVGVLALGLFLSGPAAMAVSYYTEGHTDIGLEYEDGEFIPHWHLDGGNIVDGAPIPEEGEYEPDELIAVFSGTRASPADSAGYLGIPGGTTIYMGGPSVNWQPYLGFGTEELDPADWVGGIKLTLTTYTLPENGHFALYTTNPTGTSTFDLFLSTFDPSIADVDGIGVNSFYLPAGGHEHYTFGFTAPGHYELTFEFSGVHATDGPVAGTGTFGFDVIPEPSTYGLIFVAGAAMQFIFRRRFTS